MEKTEIVKLYGDIKSFAGKSVTVCGWVRTIRVSKSIAFLELNDGSSFKGLQVILEENKLANYKEITSQNVGAAVIIKGVIVETPEMRQPFELHAEEAAVEGESSPEYPL